MRRTCMILCLWLLASFVAHAEPVPEILKYYPSVVKVIVKGVSKKTMRGKTEVGTGFIFSSEGFILTAGHIVGDSNDWQEEEDGVTSTRKVTVDRKVAGSDKINNQKAMVMYYDKALDLALLRITCEDACLPVKFGNSSLVTDETKIRGVFWGNRPSIESPDETKILSACDFKYFCMLKFNQIVVRPGDSGGPLFNSRGEVIGIVKSDGADARGDVLAIPSNMSASMRMFADIEQPEVKSRFISVEQSLHTLEKIAENLKQSVRPSIDWFCGMSQHGKQRYIERYIAIYVFPDFDDQYLPQELKLSVYPAWKVILKGSDINKNTTEMDVSQSRAENLVYKGDCDEDTLKENGMKKTAILKPFEYSFKSLLKIKYGFNDATLNTLTITGAEAEIEWKIPNLDTSKLRQQTLGAMP